MVAIQIRGVSDDVRDALAGEADRRGVSLQVFLAEVLEREAASARNLAWLRDMASRQRPAVRSATRDEIREKLAATGRTHPRRCGDRRRARGLLMLVLDASAFVDLELERATPELVGAMARTGHWVVPEHFRLEAFSAIRGAWLGGRLDDEEFDRITQRLVALDLDVWPTAPLLPRIRELASNATAYDAAYLALAEEIGSPLVTADAKFARVPGIRCRVVGWADE